MRRIFNVVIVGLIVFPLFGCFKKNKETPGNATSSTAASGVQFSKEKIQVGDETLMAEIARTDEQLQHGLMFRTSLSDNEGMLFVYSTERTLSFWMKNTFIPLSIGFFDKNGVLVDIQDMEPVKSEMEVPKTYISLKPAQYALEVRKGWFKDKKILLNAKLKASFIQE